MIRAMLGLPLHKVPFPVYPSLHMHLNEPWEFVQIALLSQLSEPDSHSLISGNMKHHKLISVKQENYTQQIQETDKFSLCTTKCHRYSPVDFFCSNGL